jgi:hypothetical protein
MEGYSLGEDVEFSFGLHFRMRLAITPTAKIWHYQSQVNRIGARRRAHDGVLFRFAQLRGHPSHFSGSAVLIGAASSVVLDGAAGLLGRRPGRMASAIGTMAGLWRLASDREARRARLGTAQPHRADRASERA